MKRYEKMTKEELIEFLVNRQCSKCKADKYCDSRSEYCEAVMQNWLNEEIEVKPRWTMIKSNEDADKMCAEFTEMCNKFGYVCGKCKYHQYHSTTAKCYTEWLKDEVEV